MPEDRADGFYFSMPEPEYHQLPRLSASGIQNLMVSPATFWAKSWLNPDRDELDKETPARILGRAYHVARLEPERFAATYVAELDKGDFEIATHDDIKAELAKLGLTQSVKGDGGVLGAAQRLRDAGFDGPIWHLALEEWKAETEGKVSLPQEYFDQVVTDAERLRMDPEIAQLLEGCAAEVSVLWTDDKGHKWKARMDYLAPTHIADLKSFGNAMGKETDRCIADAVRFNRYYIQAVLYWQAIERVRSSAAVQMETELPGSTKEQQALIAAICNSMAGPLEWWWIFTETGGIPNILARQFRMTSEPHRSHLMQAPDEESMAALKEKLTRPSKLFEKARLEIEDAVKTFDQCMEIWGTEEPWGSLRPIDEIGDDDFPPFWLEE